MEPREIALGLIELLSMQKAEPSPYYTQADSPLGKGRHLKLIRDGVIPGFKDGRTVFARREDVHQYIESQKIEPKPPKKTEEKPSAPVSLLDRVSRI